MSVLWIRRCTERFSGTDTIVAVRAGRSVGRMSLDLMQGILVQARVVPEESGHGAATALCAAIEGRARAIRIASLTRVAGEPARRFFLRLDWQAIARPEGYISGVRLHVCRLEKCLIGNGVRAA